MFKRGLINKNKSGQVTIFVIVGILIVAGVVLFFTLRGEVTDSEDKGPSVSGEINPSSYLKTCVEDRVEETIFVLSRKGGYMNNSLNINFMFTDEGKYWKITYLCYTEVEDETCKITSPSIINNMEKELKEELEEEMISCYESLISSIESKGYEIIEEEYKGFEEDLKEDRFVLDVFMEIVAKKGESTERYEDTKIEFSTKLYNFGKIAHEIISHESGTGVFDILEYSMDNPRYKIKREVRDTTKIYEITHRSTEENFRFAIRGK